MKNLEKKFNGLTVGDVIVLITDEGVIMEPKTQVIIENHKIDYLYLLKKGWELEQFDMRGYIHLKRKSSIS